MTLHKPVSVKTSQNKIHRIRHLLEKLDGFEMWRLLYREYKLDTTTTTVGLLETVMDDQPDPGTYFGDWFLRWLDLVGE